MNYHPPGYLVWNPRRGLPTYRHDTKDSAVQESERLAKENPGQEFYVMEATGVSVVEAPRVFRSFADDIPF